eukprot:jgi/Chlat1/189/Chrsp1S03107
MGVTREGEAFLGAWRNPCACAVTAALALGYSEGVGWLERKGWLRASTTRKALHVGMGPIFLQCWWLFDDSPHARYWAAAVPALAAVRAAAAGLGLTKDPQLVHTMARKDQPREILGGPLLYAIVIVAMTIRYWRRSPIGAMAILVLCFGDGLAEVAGRRWGTRRRLPWNCDKSWPGTLAVLVASFISTTCHLTVYGRLLEARLPPLSAAWAVLRISVIAALVESLPLGTIDNLVLPVLVSVLGERWLV